jgi:hypothetical protein
MRPTGTALVEIHSALNTDPVLSLTQRLASSGVALTTPSITAGRLLVYTEALGGLSFAYVSTEVHVITPFMSMAAFR